MTICATCKRVVKLAVKCICGGAFGLWLLIPGGEPHNVEQFYPMGQVRILDNATLVSSSSSPGPAPLVSG